MPPKQYSEPFLLYQGLERLGRPALFLFAFCKEGKVPLSRVVPSGSSQVSPIHYSDFRGDTFTALKTVTLLPAPSYDPDMLGAG